jgi:branched-chain amino acid transport system permease protein
MSSGTVMAEGVDTARIGGVVHETRDAKVFHRMVFIGLTVLLLIAPFVLYPVFLMKVLCFALFASAFNLLLGFGGLMSFGHAAYFGIASYLSAHAAKVWGFSPELAILTGTATGTLLGIVFGWLAIKRQGIYFAMITLALSQMVYFFSVQAPFTGGEDGIQAVPRGKLFGLLDLSHDLTLYFVVVAIFLFGLLAIYRTIHSPFGQVMKSIRDNEPRAISLGYRADHYKLALFVMSTAIAALAGATKAIVFQLASLTDVHWSMSGEPVLMTLVGGLGTVFGPMVGAAVIVTMQNYLATLGAWVLVVQGVIFVVCVLAFREGIVGLIAKLLRRPL